MEFGYDVASDDVLDTDAGGFEFVLLLNCVRGSWLVDVYRDGPLGAVPFLAVAALRLLCPFAAPFVAWLWIA